MHTGAQRTGTLVAMAAVALLIASGCGRTRVAETVRTDYDQADIISSVDFWHALPARSAVTNDEGIHGLILFADGEDPNSTYEQRLDYIKALGWLDDSFDESGDLAMQRGTLAKLLAHALDIEGGVMMRLTKKSTRYSTRELVYLGVFPQGTENMVLSGYQYIGVISKAQDYELLRDGRRDAEIPPSAEELDALEADATDDAGDDGAGGDSGG